MNFEFSGPGGGPACRQAGLVDASRIMYYVYCLKSIERNYIYVGLTDNIERRIDQHNSGQNKTTRTYRPFRLIHHEVFETRVLARQREKYLKSGVGKEFLRALIK